MRKIVLLCILQIFFLQNMFSQTLQYKAIKDTSYTEKRKNFTLNKDEIVEWKINDYLYVYYDSYNQEREMYNLLLGVLYNDKTIYPYIYNSDFELLNSEKVFYQEYFNFIPVYYLDLLKTKNINLIINNQQDWNKFKKNYRTFEGETFYESFYPEEIVLSNLYIYFTLHNFYITKRIVSNSNLYEIEIHRNPTTITGDNYIFEYEQPYPKTYMKYKNENDIKLLCKFDGDYVDIWINSIDEYMGKYFVAPKNTTQKEINELVSTGNFNKSNVYWPRHADGTSDFDKEIKPPMVELVKNTEVKEEKILKSVSISKERISKSTESAVSASSTTQAPSTNVTVNKNMLVTENLKLRSGEATTTSVLTVMQAGTKVKILQLGKAETIDGINSNWVKVEVISGRDRDGKDIKKKTTGWCYGGYLK